MSFGSPLFLLSLLVVPAVCVFALLIECRRSRYPVAFTNLELLSTVAHERRSWRRWIPVALLLLALVAASTALAKPRASFSVPDQNATVVLLVDVSGSMRANDVEPTRLDAAVAAMNTFLDKLPKQFKVGLVAFSSDPEPLVQPTANRDELRQALQYLEPQSGTAIGDGLQTAVEMVKTSLARAGIVRKPGQHLPAAIVLLSDGAQNRGTLQPLQAAAHAKASGIPVDTIAFGTPNGEVNFGFGLYVNRIPVPPDPPTMRAIAKATDGKMFTAESATSASRIYKSLGSSLGRQKTSREIGSWFALAAAVLLIGAVGAGVAAESRLP
jgi:Ca-activated chloride channel homolog